MGRVTIVDHGLCNLDSIGRAVECCGGQPSRASYGHEIKHAARIILPGVGAFPDAMQSLRERGFIEPLTERVAQGIPLLGICLGMQLLMPEGDEVRPTAGLGLIPGRVEKLRAEPGERVPHMGWNALNFRKSCPLFWDLKQDADFYFVHSYAVVCERIEHVMAKTPFAGGFASSVAVDTVYGVQFHPEKSQRVGFKLLTNFLERS